MAFRSLRVRLASFVRRYSQEYGRRKEPYDDDVFWPIDEAGPRSRRVLPRPSERPPQRQRPAPPEKKMKKMEQFLLEHRAVLEAPGEAPGLLPEPIRSFEDAKFPEEVLRHLKNAGFQQPTPIQAISWPIAMAGEDLVALAETGSGKTLAYLIPGMLKALKALSEKDLKENRRDENQSELQSDFQSAPICLVLAPSRELVLQIQLACFHLAQDLGLRDLAVYGGVPRRSQEKELRRGCDVLMATPGRLIDLVEAKATDLSRVRPTTS